MPWYSNYVMVDALDINSIRCVITSYVWNHLVYTCVQKWWLVHCWWNVSHVINRYCNIPLVSLIKNAKNLKVTSCKIKHNYCEWKVRVLATLTWVWAHGDIQSHHHGWLHCVWMHGNIQSHHCGWLLAYARGVPGQDITRGRCNTWCWLHCLGGRWVCGCRRSYICVDVLVKPDGIWVTVTNVVTGTSILSITNDLDIVWSMVCCVDDGSREPQVSGIVENGYGLTSKQWGFLPATLMVMVCCTWGGKLV